MLFLIIYNFVFTIKFLSCFLNYKDYNGHNHRETQLNGQPKPNNCVNNVIAMHVLKLNLIRRKYLTYHILFLNFLYFVIPVPFLIELFLIKKTCVFFCSASVFLGFQSSMNIVIQYVPINFGRLHCYKNEGNL